MTNEKTVGITGWRGFIGSRLRDRIENPVLFHGDMKNLASVERFVRKCDRIYHLAGKNREEDGGILANNLVATGNLVLASLSQETPPEIVFLSSVQAEQNPTSEYGLTKLMEEALVRRAAKWSIFRVPNVYGAGGRPFYNSVVATFTYQIAHGLAISIPSPNTTREFLFVDDLVDALALPVVLYRRATIRGETMSIRKVYEYLTNRLGEHEKLKRCLDYYTGLDK